MPRTILFDGCPSVVTILVSVIKAHSSEEWSIESVPITMEDGAGSG